MPLDRIACYYLLLLKGYVSVTTSAGLWYVRQKPVQDTECWTVQLLHHTAVLGSREWGRERRSFLLREGLVKTAVPMLVSVGITSGKRPDNLSSGLSCSSPGPTVTFILPSRWGTDGRALWNTGCCFTLQKPASADWAVLHPWLVHTNLYWFSSGFDKHFSFGSSECSK